MNTAHLGRRLGDWLGIVPEDEVPVAEMPGMAAPDYFDIEHLEQLAPVTTAPAPVAEPVIAATSWVVSSTPVSPRFDPPATPEPPAPSPVRSGAPNPEPARNVRSFRDVVNQRRAEAQRRGMYPQAPPRW